MPPSRPGVPELLVVDELVLDVLDVVLPVDTTVPAVMPLTICVYVSSLRPTVTVFLVVWSFGPTTRTYFAPLLVWTA